MEIPITSTIKLNDGKNLPLFGMGLSHQQGGWSTSAIKRALAEGVRLFDTAARYGSERDVGLCLAAAPALPEGEVVNRVVTTKIWPGDLPCHGSDEDFASAVEAAARKSLENLGMASVNNLLLHWPAPWGDSRADPSAWRKSVWRGMVAVKELGLAKTIGVSNFESRGHLRDVTGADGTGVLPAFNQIELNPLQHQQKLLDHLADMGIAVQGYCPFAKGTALRHRKILDLATRIVRRAADENEGGKTVWGGGDEAREAAAAAAAAAAATAATATATAGDAARLLLRWSIERKGASTIPKTRSAEHLCSNLEGLKAGYGGDLLEETYDALDDLDMNLRSTWDPSTTS